MTDFLRRLAERAVGAPAEVRPALPPRFASFAAPPSASAPVLPSVEEVNEEASASPSPAASASSPLRARRRPTDAPSPVHASEEGERGVFVPATPRRSSAPSGDPRIPVPPVDVDDVADGNDLRPVPAPGARPTRTEEDAPSRPRSSVDSLDGRPTTTSPVVSRGGEATPGITPVPSPPPTPTSRGDIERETPLPAVERMTMGDVLSPADRPSARAAVPVTARRAAADALHQGTERSPVVATAAGRGDVSPSFDRRDSEPPAAPTIEVTIGRVEVRAVVAAPPPRPARPVPTAPTVSLDDYLRARGKGGR